MPGPITLEDYMARDVKAWVPNKEADHPRYVVGIIVKVTTTTSDYTGGEVPVIELVPADDADIVWRITGYHTVLAREIAEQRPAVGDRAGVKYLGRIDGAKSSYESYRVVVDKANAPAVEIDWDSLEAEAREAADTDGVDNDEQEPF
jgi:hypothetical protein